LGNLDESSFDSQVAYKENNTKEPNRVKKMMSYLEGDSLLKEIEKSLDHELEDDDYGNEKEFEDPEGVI